MSFKIYTKTGDEGMTSLWGGARVPKHHIRIESYGTVDELNSFIGLLRDQLDHIEIREKLYEIQHVLFTAGSILAADPEKKDQIYTPSFPADIIHQIETWIDEMDLQLEPLKNFILPGGHVAVSTAHLCRCVCRRAERIIVALHELEPLNLELIQFFNRLSDYFFVLSRYISQLYQVKEVIWISK